MRAGLAAAAATLLLLATPANAQSAPADTLSQATAARLGGEPEEAVRLLEPLVAAEPGNSDAQVQLGYALLALDRLEAAERAFRSALVVAPDYADARLGLARIAQRRGDRQAALGEIEQLGTANAEADLLREQILAQPDDLPWSLDLDGSFTAVGGGRSDWADGAVQLRRRISARTTASARLEVSRRFALTDVYGEVALEQAFGDRARAHLTIGGTPQADFRPRWQIGAGGSVRVRDGGSATVLTLDARQAEFVSGDVQSLSPGLEQYLLQGKAWVSVRWINLFDGGDHTSGYLVRGDAQVTDDLRFYAGYSNAPDTSEGVVLDTHSAFAGLSYAVSEQVTVRASAAVDDPDAGPTRKQIGLGLGWRF